MVNTNKIELDPYQKNDLGKWEIINYGVGSMVELKSVNLTFPIEDLFDSISF